MVPFFGDEFTEGEQRAARDEEGKTYYVPADMTYLEWKEKFVENEENPVIIKEKVSDELKKELTSQLDSLTEEEKAVITHYTGFGGQIINSAIASGRITNQIQKKIDLLDQALEKGIIPQDITVIRKTIPEYMNYFTKEYPPTKENILNLKGNCLINNIFTSTALKEFKYEGRTIELHIHIPKGYRGALYVKELASKKYKKQEEILFKREFTYEVTKVVYKEEEKIYYMEAFAV